MDATSILLLVALGALSLGLTLGVLGGGGSVLAVPLLVWVAGYEPHVAIAMSLLIVGATSASCTVAHHRSGNVDVKTGVLFGAFSMVGAYAGGSAAGAIPGNWLLGAFTVAMVAAAVGMLRGRKPLREVKPSKLQAAALGVALGAFTGLVGAGGGFLAVPLLTLVLGMPMRKAIGTSSLVIAMNATAGFIGQAQHTSIDLGVAVGLAVVATVGGLVGARIAARAPVQLLRKGFAVLVLCLATAQFAQLVGPDAFVDHPWIVVATAALLASLALARAIRPSTSPS